MNPFLHGVVHAVAETFDLPEPIVEMGALQIEGQEHISNLRPFFTGKTYHGLDFRTGPGVDIVGNVESLPLPDRSIGTIIALSTFEHVQRFWRGFDEIYRVLRPDGAVLISCPFYLHVHAFPSDYWRFTPEALDFMLERYPVRIIGSQGPSRRPAHVWALGLREDYPRPTPEQWSRYQGLIGRYAHQPIAWHRLIRYQVARWLCGRRPFAPHLDRQRWETECRTSKAS
jgi:SAM-dependent methyltransferase